MAFENATPRPWTKNQYGQLEGSNGRRVHVYDLGVGMAMNSPDQEERDNAELFLTAVNAHAMLAEALEELLRIDNAREESGLIIHRMPAHIRRKAEAALKLARAES